MGKYGLVEKGYIPLDKSWIIRMGVLDLLHKRKEAISFLEPLANKGMLSDDLHSLYTASVAWAEGTNSIYVGESGTLYRFLKFASWKFGYQKEFIVKGTLEKRRRIMCNDPSIVNLPLEELLKLDHETSQWASAAVICGNGAQPDAERHKLNLTYEAVGHWKEQRAAGKIWEPRHDKTIEMQAEAYLGLLAIGKMEFAPQQPEDYCFARAFGAIREDEVGKYAKIWKSLEGHESNRIKDMEAALKQYHAREKVTSEDHRVVQAIAMSALSEKRGVDLTSPYAVNKSWPEFWRFMACSKSLAK